MTGLVSLGTIGLIQTAGADPDGSQRMRGSGGRVFFIGGTYLFAADGVNSDPFQNCDYFNEDGEWVDPLFLPPPFPIFPGL